MEQLFTFNPSMTHPFLTYAENTQISNVKVLQLIDELRKGLSEEDNLQEVNQECKLYSQKQKNVMTCYCILLYIQCLAYISVEHELYDLFLNNWIAISAF